MKNLWKIQSNIEQYHNLIPGRVLISKKDNSKSLTYQSWHHLECGIIYTIYNTGYNTYEGGRVRAWLKYT